MLDVACPVDVFAEANAFIDDGDRYEIVLVGPGLREVRASNGTRLLADLSFREATKRFDIALVAGGPSLPVAAPDTELTHWLATIAAQCPRYGSICTGAFVLGHAGLLDGRNVTTHWQNARQPAERFPKARVELDRIVRRESRDVSGRDGRNRRGARARRGRSRCASRARGGETSRGVRSAARRSIAIQPPI